MKYESFEIEHYKGIANTTVSFQKNTIMPIVGVNESGKTTILRAILAFDKYNDKYDDGKHLQDTVSYYDLVNTRQAKVTATIDIEDKEELLDYLTNLISKDSDDNYKDPVGEEHLDEIQRLIFQLGKTDKIKVTRNIPKKRYTTNFALSEVINDKFCEELLRLLPFILYFDDFRDSIDQYIHIPSSKNEENQSSWVPYIQELLKQTNEEYSVYDLPSKNSNQRDSIIRGAQKVLQNVLIKNWSTFNIDGKQPLNIEIKYHSDDKLEFRIVESINVGEDSEERFFNIKDRSKGFFWYFNFIMKLEFNPQKRNNEDKETIYLLDEPGSFLHSDAQSKLCTLLRKLSNRNIVVYCTHSPYLLSPEFIPINTIMVAEKKDGVITLNSIHKSKATRNNAAFQPVLDALYVKPIVLTYDVDNIVLVEGIYDYYLFNSFNTATQIQFFPSDGASSIKHHISYMIFLGKNYSVIWDNDKEGRMQFESAKSNYGEIESEKWLLLPLGENKSKATLETLMDAVDVEFLKSRFDLPHNTTFEKIVQALYYHEDRHVILLSLSNETKQNIQRVIDLAMNKLGLS